MRNFDKMKITDERIEFVRRLKIKKISEILASESGIFFEEALRQFAKTKTYDLLEDNESMLYVESEPYILDMLRSELNEDWENWLKI